MMKWVKEIFKNPWIEQMRVSANANNPEIYRCVLTLDVEDINLFIDSFSQGTRPDIVRYNQFGSVENTSHFENAQMSEQTFYIFNGKRERSEYASIIEDFPNDVFSHPEIIKDIEAQTVIIVLYQIHKTLELCCGKEALFYMMDFYKKTLFKD